MADGAQVDADLVRPAGGDRDLQQRDALEVPRPRDARDRAARAARPRRHLLPVLRVAPDRRVDAPPGVHDAPDERDVFLLDFAVAETAATAPGGPCRSWPRPSAPTCRDRADARCPGRSSPPMPLRSLTWWSSALTSVPLLWPAAGCTTIPAGLSSTTTSGSSKRMRSGSSSGSGRRRRRRGDVDRRSVCPARTAVLGRSVARRSGDAAVLDQPLHAATATAPAAARSGSCRAARRRARRRRRRCEGSARAQAHSAVALARSRPTPPWRVSRGVRRHRAAAAAEHDQHHER